MEDFITTRIQNNIKTITTHPKNRKIIVSTDSQEAIIELINIEQKYITKLFTDIIRTNEIIKLPSYKKLFNEGMSSDEIIKRILYNKFGIIISEFNYHYNKIRNNKSYGKDYNLDVLPAIEKVNKFNRNLLKNKIRIVENSTTNDIIIEVDMKYKEKKCVILNFASSVKIGGGYKSGVLHTQEEQLCYTLDNLYNSLIDIAKKMDDSNRSLPKKLYYKKKWDNRKVLYSWNIHLSRNNNFKYGKIYDTFKLEKHDYPNIFPLRDEKIHGITVISAAAPDLGKGKEKYARQEYEDKLKAIESKYSGDKIIEQLSNILIFQIFKKVVYNICILNNKVFDSGIRKDTKPTILVLGAFGAGAFSPKYKKELYIKTIAKVMFDVLIDYEIYKYFEYIYIPMLEKDKYDIFVEAFNKKLKICTNDCISYKI